MAKLQATYQGGNCTSPEASGRAHCGACLCLCVSVFCTEMGILQLKTFCKLCKKTQSMPVVLSGEGDSERERRWNCNKKQLVEQYFKRKAVHVKSFSVSGLQLNWMRFFFTTCGRTKGKLSENKRKATKNYIKYIRTVLYSRYNWLWNNIEHGKNRRLSSWNIIPLSNEHIHCLVIIHRK